MAKNDKIKPLTDVQLALAETFLQPFDTPQQMRDWIYNFFDIDFPMGRVDPDSNTSPIEWMFEAYDIIRHNKGGEIPQIVVFSSRDSYKCQIKGTKLLSPKGLVNIEDVKIGDVVWTGKSWRKVTNWIDDGVKDGIKVKLANGIECIGSPIHRYWGIRDGQQQWIKSLDIKEGDLIHVNLPSTTKYTCESQEEYDIGYFLGLLIGDGSLSFLEYKKGSPFFALTSVDEYIKTFFFDFCRKRWNYEPKSCTDKITYRIGIKEAVKWVLDQGVKPVKSSEKTIPHSCFLSRDRMVGFINGVFDTDGSVSSKGSVLWSMTAGTLLKEMQQVLLSWGVNAKLSRNKNKPSRGNHFVHLLSVSSNEYGKLTSCGFSIKAKKAASIQSAKIMDAHDTIPVNQVSDFLEFYSKQAIQNGREKLQKKKPRWTKDSYQSIPYAKLLLMTDWLKFAAETGRLNCYNETVRWIKKIEALCKDRWFQVTSIEKTENSHFFDLTVEEDHSYWSNGTVSHNTLSCSALEVINMVHFKSTVAHMAAIKSQSAKAIQYINGFLRKIEPYLEYHGISITSQNTSNISITDSEGNKPYTVVIVCSMTGANSEHTNFMCVDKDTKILIRAIGKTAENRDRQQVQAQNVYNKFQKGKSIEVLTFNHLTGAYEFKRVLNAYKNNKKCYKIVTESGRSVSATSEHRFFVNGKGYLELKNIEPGDELLFIQKVKSGTEIPSKDFNLDYHINCPDSTEFRQIILGSLLGDGGVYRKTSNNAYFAMTHGLAQEEYANYKMSILSNTLRMNKYPSIGGYNNDVQIRVHSGCTPVLNDWVDFRKTMNGVEELGPLGLAVWFQDDGSIGNGLRLNTQSFTYEQNLKLKDVLWNNFGIEVTVATEEKKDGRRYYYLSGKGKELSKIEKICHRYIHPSMMYKFSKNLSKKLCKSCGTEFFIGHEKGSGFKARYCGSTICQSIAKKKLRPDRIVSIKSIGNRDVYDFTVDGNNNYFADQFLTHNCVDEIDVVPNPQAFEEAKMIPGMLHGRYPLTIMTSTRKFAFGLMQKEIERAQGNGHPIRHWNILDITEHCPPERNKRFEPKIERYIARSLPLQQLSIKEYESLPDEKKGEYQLIEAHAGCAECKLLPVCKTRLADRPETDRGGLWKPIDFTINQFFKIEPDMAEAQLLCWKPSSTGLVYPRFDSNQNTISLEEAYYQFTGDQKDNVTLNDVIFALIDANINFYVGGDWGFRHNFALLVGAILPSGEFWILETFAMPGLEFPDMMKYAEYIRDKYRPKKWFMDTAQPMFIKSFRKAGMPCKDFKKDVSGGIAAGRGQIVDASNRRRLKVLLTEENKILLKGFATHHFKTDAAGNITSIPDDEDYADILDSYRYMCQNLFAPKGKLSAGDLKEREQDIIKHQSMPQFQPSPGQRNYFQEIFDNTVDKDSKPGKGKNSNGSIFWDFSDT